MRYWRRLDNAAKIFPSAANGHDTNVFRVYCELNESIQKEYLQSALDLALKQYPVYCSVMKKGLFWYYLEESEIRPKVKEEYKKPCTALYDKDVKKLLFEVTYFNNRINLETYHVLMDGSGAINFLRCIVINYLSLKYSINDIEESMMVSAVNPIYDDNYTKFYEKNKKKNNKSVKAYKLKGIKTPKDEIKIIEATMSTKMLLDKAHLYNSTLTSFLVAILLKSIYEEMTIGDRYKTVVVSVPVNLRKYFNTETARNFFGVIFVKYNFSKQSSDFNQIIKYVDKTLKEELKEDKIKLRMNSLIGVEKNPVIRIIPLFLKNLVLNIAFKITEIYETTTVSNMGKIYMPDKYEKYIFSFGMFVSTNKIQLGICSFNDVTTISFSSCFINTDIQRRFIREIATQNIPIEILSN